MSESRVEHRFAVIFCADVVGYSRLMGIDEEGTLAAVRKIRGALVDPQIAAHRGRIVRTMGDGRTRPRVDLVVRLNAAGHVEAIAFLNRVFLPTSPDF